MKRPGYREAIFWIAANDDTEWLRDEDPILSVTAALVQDLFGAETGRLITDLRRAVAKREASDD
jgi:hypothetical protein